MTAVEITTPAAVAQPQIVVWVAPDFREAVATAQAVGDMAYELAQDAGASREDCADAYHAEFTDVMRALGYPVTCSCTRCMQPTL